MQEKRGGIVIFVFVFLLIGLGLFALVYFVFPAEDEGTDTTTPPATADGGEQPAMGEDRPPESDALAEPVLNETVNETLPVEIDYASLADSFSGSSEIHWKQMPLTYQIFNKTDNCSSNALDEFYEAIDLIEENTNGAVSFSELNASNTTHADIDVYCVQNEALLNESLGGLTCKVETFDYERRDINPFAEGFIDEKDIFVDFTLLNRTVNETEYEICFVSQSAPAWIYEQLEEPRIEILNNSYIGSARMNIFSDGWNDCAQNPIVELHSLFHVLGIGHIKGAQFDPEYGWVPIDYPLLRDTMYEQIQCQFQQYVSPKYYTCLEKIYTNGERGECEDVNFVYFENGEWKY